MANFYVLRRLLECQKTNPLLEEIADWYVFGSLLSRNTTYRLMHHVWLKSADPDSTEESPSENSEPGTSDEPVPPPPSPMPIPVVEEAEMDEELAEAVRRLSRRKSEMFPRISAKALRRQGPPSSSSVTESVVEQITLSECNWECSKAAKGLDKCFVQSGDHAHGEKNNLSKTTLVLSAATLMLIFLFLFATVLVYRVSIVHSKGASVEENWSPKNHHKLTNYLELLKQQQDAVEDEIQRITTTLKLRMDELGQVRQSIDKLMGIAGSGSCRTEKDTVENPAEFTST